jgi:hypothetical protein
MSQTATAPDNLADLVERLGAAMDTVATLTAADTLGGGDVLPGLRLPLRDLFAELDRQG